MSGQGQREDLKRVLDQWFDDFLRIVQPKGYNPKEQLLNDLEAALMTQPEVVVPGAVDDAADSPGVLRVEDQQ